MGFGVLHHVVMATEPLVACWLSTLEWFLNDTLLLTTCYPSSFCLLLRCVSFHVVSSALHDRIAWCNWDIYMQIFFYEWEQLSWSIVHWWRVLLSCCKKKWGAKWKEKAVRFILFILCFIFSQSFYQWPEEMKGIEDGVFMLNCNHAPLLDYECPFIKMICCLWPYFLSPYGYYGRIVICTELKK